MRFGLINATEVAEITDCRNCAHFCIKSEKLHTPIYMLSPSEGAEAAPLGSVWYCNLNKDMLRSLRSPNILATFPGWSSSYPIRSIPDWCPLPTEEPGTGLEYATMVEIDAY